MQILFIHQGFPGQYLHIIRYLALDRSNILVGLGLVPRPSNLPQNFLYYQYFLSRGTSKSTDFLAQEFEAKTIRAFACASKLDELKKDGFIPNIICAHPGWGESLLIRAIYPDVPLLSYQEYFYRLSGFDYGFDPEHLPDSALLSRSKLLLKNTHLLSVLEDSTHNVTPTYFQKSSFPAKFHTNISVLHDGVIVPDLNAPPRDLFLGTKLLTKDSKIITFINRTLEPYRGCHTFIRSIPLIFENHPDAFILIIGSREGTSYGSPPEGSDSWGDIYFKTIEGMYPSDRVFFTGSIPYDVLSNIFRLSSCHIYLTYPFVLSWSLLDAMAHCVPIIASATAPVMELIQHENNGLLVDFFDPKQLADRVSEVLNDPFSFCDMSTNARELIVDRFSINHCVPSHISLINAVANGVYR